MADRSGHGSGKGSPRIETLPFDELPTGIPAFAAEPDSAKAARLRAGIAALEAQLDGASAGPERMRLLARKGGLARALNYELARVRSDQHGALVELAKELLPGMAVEDEVFRAALPHAIEFITSEMNGLARDVAGGYLPNGPASMVVSAALELVASRVLFARGDYKAASALAQASGQSLAKAHEYGVKRALARQKAQQQQGATPWLTAGSAEGSDEPEESGE